MTYAARAAWRIAREHFFFWQAIAAIHERETRVRPEGFYYFWRAISRLEDTMRNARGMVPLEVGHSEHCCVWSPWPPCPVDVLPDLTIFGVRFCVLMPYCRLGGEGQSHLADALARWLECEVTHDSEVASQRRAVVMTPLSDIESAQLHTFFREHALFESSWGTGRRYVLLADLMRTRIMRSRVFCRVCRARFDRWPEDGRSNFVTIPSVYSGRPVAPNADEWHSDFFTPTCSRRCADKQQAAEERRQQARDAEYALREQRQARSLLRTARTLARDAKKRTAAVAAARAAARDAARRDAALKAAPELTADL